MIVNTKCFGKLLLFINAKNYQITNQITRKNLLASSFLFLFTIAFIPIASAQKAVILNFDDDWKGQFTYALPILEKYGFKASFFVTCGCLTYQNGSFCNNAGGDSAMTWEDNRVLSELGQDIQSHGMSHKDVTTLSATDLDYEIGESKKCLLDRNINATVFGTPYASGWGNATVVNAISKYYDIGRMGYEPLVYLNFTDRYSLPVWTDYDLQAMYGDNGTNRDNSTNRDNGTNRDNSTMILNAFIETVNSQSQYNTNGTIAALPIIVYHNVDYKNNTSPSWLDSTIDVNLFDREMKYLHDNGFQVLPMSDLGYNQTSNQLYIKK